MDKNSFQLDPAELAEIVKNEREGVNLLPLLIDLDLARLLGLTKGV